jgi:hypothetical protein
MTGRSEVPASPCGKDANWSATAPRKPWIALFGFYGLYKRCSTRRGRCRTSRRHKDRGGHHGEGHAVDRVDRPG